MPKVSIIIPVYNSSRTLVRCLDSILAQSCADFEVLLVDDGSTDDSVNICQKYVDADSRVHLLQQANSGPAVARNAGLDMATGEWISFVDSDDWVSPKIYSDLAGNADFVDLIVFGFRIEELGRKIDILYESSRTESREDVSARYKDLKVYLWNKLFRRDIITSATLRFKSDVKFGEDLIFLLDYLRHTGTTLWSDIIGYHYNMLSASATAHLSFKQMELPAFASNLNSIIDAFVDYSKSLSNPQTILSSATTFFYSSFYARPIALTDALERSKSFCAIIQKYEFLKPDAYGSVPSKLSLLIYHQDKVLIRIVSFHNKSQVIKHALKTVLLRVASLSHIPLHHTTRILLH